MLPEWRGRKRSLTRKPKSQKNRQQPRLWSGRNASWGIFKSIKRFSEDITCSRNCNRSDRTTRDSESSQSQRPSFPVDGPTATLDFVSTSRFVCNRILRRRSLFLSFFSLFSKKSRGPVSTARTCQRQAIWLISSQGSVYWCIRFEHPLVQATGQPASEHI